MDYETFFVRATGLAEPYGYQRQLAMAPWPDLLGIPTGLGKTAAVTLAWAYKRRILKDPETPRRLVWCLPMRVVAEQTVGNVRTWLASLDLLGEPGEGRVSVHLLMGGEAGIRAAHWAHYPEEDAILIGTQDMLLSRALMRGYGMSRYQWPVHFALLHNDALWVYDEVQLMGAALPTSTQLEGFRRGLVTSRPARSLWVSATLHKGWLGSVDFRNAMDHLRSVELSDADLGSFSLQRRLSAQKHLCRASTCLDRETGKKKAAAYLDALAEEIAAAHREGLQTLVILNRVARAQGLYGLLKKKLPRVECLLLHARFRPAERCTIEARLHAQPSESGRIVVATQAVEAGVDISSRVLFTELAPWPSLVQRFGRCNRAGEHEAAEVYWIDIADDAGEAAPYEPLALSASRERLLALANVAIPALPRVDDIKPAAQVLRRKDLLELFNTDPDLSGFDVDIAPYVRDPGTPQVQVFWRDFDQRPAGDEAPSAEELCPVGLGQFRDYLARKGRAAWRWDPLGDRWERLEIGRLFPGQVHLLRAKDGGYSPEMGFVAHSPEAVAVVESRPGGGEESYSGDPWTMIGREVLLGRHLEDVAGEADRLAEALGLEAGERAILVEAGRWHDIGKAHEAFQRGIAAGEWDAETLLAKSKGTGRPNYHTIDQQGKAVKRPGFRHELASMLAWLAHGGDREHRDLIAYLIAAHHGKVRMGLRALPIEKEPPDPERLFARGVWQGDRLPAIEMEGRVIPQTTLHLDIMRLGLGPQGPSWTERTRRLLEAHGPFRLAWLEALVRIADWRASAREAANGGEP